MSAGLASSLCATPVAVIGVGNMGLGMTLRLRDAGQAVTVHDLDPAREAQAAAAGAQVATAPDQAAAGCSLLIVVVVDAAQTADVLFGARGAAAALAPGGAVMLCPTIGPVDVERFADQLAALGLGCIDAPMSGGPVRARDGSMSLLVACTEALWRAHLPLLRHLAARLFHVGQRPGDGARTKLVNNLLAAVNLAGAAEAIALAQRLGLDGAATLAVIAQSSGQSWIGSDRMARALAGDFAPRAHTTLLAKDSALALAMAAQAGVTPVLGSQAAALFQAALAAGYGPEDDARLLSLIDRQWAATTAAADPAADGSAQSAP
jgi:3-hydroxyisobutyrate dehydrogenase